MDGRGGALTVEKGAKVEIAVGAELLPELDVVIGRNGAVTEFDADAELEELEDGPTKKKFPATGSPRFVFAAKSVTLKFVLGLVPLINMGPVMSKSSGWVNTRTTYLVG